MKNSTFKIVAAITAFLVIVMFLNYAGTLIGLPANTTTQILYAMPGIVIFFIGAGIIFSTGISIFALPGFSALGIGLAILLGAVQIHNIYPVEQIGGATIAQVQWIVIILTSVVGGIIAASSRGRG